MSRGRARTQRPARPGGIGSAEVVYEDDHLLIVNKPAGVLTAAERSDSRRTLHDAVLDHVRSNSDVALRVRPINLLDRMVSGLVVFAKSKRVETALESLFRRNRVRRIYAAVLTGTFDAGEGATGTVQSTPRDLRKQRQRRGGPPTSPTPAVTHYRLLHQTDQATLVQLRPETHRRGQLIDHMRQLDRPIIGDDPRRAAGPLMLHLEQIAFEHPRTGQDVRASAPRPHAFDRIMAAVPSEAGRSDESADSTSWQPVARWYSDYHATRKSDHFTNVIYPGSLALLGDVSNKRVLDVACGEGAFAAHLTEAGAVVTGVDAAPDLIDTAKARRLRGAVFEIGDANDLDSAGDAARGPFDAAACVMAIMNIANLDSTLAGIAARLTAAAPLVLVLLHPAFRSPKQASWGWDEGDPGRPRQYRRVDAYLSESRTPIVMNPGEASRGRPPVETITFHRPLSAYIRSLSNAGFVVDSLEEWPSQRTSEPGPRADEENRARAEIPLFLGIRAIMSRRSH